VAFGTWRCTRMGDPAGSSQKARKATPYSARFAPCHRNGGRSQAVPENQPLQTGDAENPTNFVLCLPAGAPESGECGVRSAEFKVWSVECGVWNLEFMPSSGSGGE